MVTNHKLGNLMCVLYFQKTSTNPGNGLSRNV